LLSAIGPAFHRAADAAETDAFPVVIVDNVDCVAVEDGDDGAGGVSPHRNWQIYRGIRIAAHSHVSEDPYHFPEV
jgi:hypothetical protein